MNVALPIEEVNSAAVRDFMRRYGYTCARKIGQDENETEAWEVMAINASEVIHVDNAGTILEDQP